MYVRSNNHGEFGGQVQLGDLPETLVTGLDADRRRLQTATDSVIAEFEQIRKLFIRSIVGADEIEFHWRERLPDVVELKRHRDTLKTIVAAWLEADSSADIEAMLLDALVRCGEPVDSAREAVTLLRREAFWGIQAVEEAVCESMRGGNAAAAPTLH
jgi:hypothetical protein